MATATERPVRGQNRVRGLHLAMGNLTDTRACGQGMILGSVLSTTSATTTTNRHFEKYDYASRAPAPE